MSEESHGIEQSSQQNKVTDFVISSINSYEELNAPTFKEGDTKFRHALISVIKKKGAGAEIKSNRGLLVVNELSDNDDIVVKRLITGEEETDSNVAKRWERLQEEHRIVERYFGRRFVPPTDFITVDQSLGSAQEAGVQPGREYVMVQERLKGEKYPQEIQESQQSITPKLKEELVEFIKNYEKMLGEEKAAIDDQIMIDFTEETVKIYDTNTLSHFEDHFDLERPEIRYFLNSVRIKPESVHTSEDIMNALIASLPEFRDLRGKDYYTAFDRINGYEAKRKFLERYPHTSDPAMLQGFGELIDAVDLYPPEGFHNYFIRGLMNAFKITDLDLATRL